MIEEEEKIVFYLEELDNNFSKINRTLKEIEEKINNIYKINYNVIKDYSPFIKMFKNESLEETNSFENGNSSIIMKTSSPKNPFVDDKNDLIEQNSSSTINDPKIYSDSYLDESSSTEINAFDIEKVPDIFREEEDFFKLYNFISHVQKAKFEDIIDAFNDVDYNKLCVYLEVLRNKKFIRKKGNLFFIEQI